MSLLYHGYRPVVAFVKCCYRLKLRFFKNKYILKKAIAAFINATIGYRPIVNATIAK